MTTQPPCIDDRIRENDRAFLRLPLVDHDISYNEVHAVAIGATLGLLIGDNAPAARTLRHEPWYALAALAVCYALARYFS